MNKYLVLIFSLLSVWTEASYLDFLSSDRRVSYNSLGQTGIINTPSAETHDELSIYATFTKNDVWKLGTLTVTPYKWLEASYFYYRPDDLLWGGATGLYLDKGFNVKFSYKPKYKNLPILAIGLDDFAGTGQFTREYIASTANFNNLKVTLGLGWGKYAGDNSFENPLSFLSERFNIRQYYFSNQGGSPEYKKWFRGEAAIFGGVEWFLPNYNGLKLKVELDPFDYLEFSCCGEGRGPLTEYYRKKDSNINFGISYPLNDFGNLNLSFIKGNMVNLSLTFGFSSKEEKKIKEKFNAAIENPNFNSNPKDEFYKDILHNLNSNRIFLQTAHLSNDNSLSMTIDSPDLRNPIQSASRAAYVVKEVAKFNNFEIDNIDVGNLVRGFEINNLKFRTTDINKSNTLPIELVKLNSSINNIEPYNYKQDEFQPLLKFPIFFNSINPDIRSHVGNPQKFYYGGIGIKLDSEVLLNRGLVFTSSLGINIDDNFDDINPDPNSVVKHVRTEIVSYLQEGDVYLNRMQLDYIWAPFKGVYAKVSGGILEEMYGGVGAEFMYKPFNKNFSIGYERFYLKRRTYEQRFKFFNEDVILTDHVNFLYSIPKPEMLVNLSYGNYLAGDKGYTLDLSRVSKTGWRAGFYFTRTDMSFREFGEGSFDKGFYINIPTDLIFKKYSKGNSGFHLKSMTRDGGQKVVNFNSLNDMIHYSNRHEIKKSWYSFLK